MRKGSRTKTLLRNAERRYLQQRQATWPCQTIYQVAISAAKHAHASFLMCSQTASLQNCMLSNKEYYAPVLEDKELFEESKNKFDAAPSNENPQEASTSDENQGTTDEAEADGKL